MVSWMITLCNPNPRFGPVPRTTTTVVRTVTRQNLTSAINFPQFEDLTPLDISINFLGGGGEVWGIRWKGRVGDMVGFYALRKRVILFSQSRDDKSIRKLILFKRNNN